MSKANKIRRLFTNNVVDVASGLFLLNCVGKVLTEDFSAAYEEVGEFNIVRLEIAADTFVAFSDETGGAAVDVSTSPAVKLVGAGVHYVIANCKYMRCSTNPTRVELLEL